MHSKGSLPIYTYIIKTVVLIPFLVMYASQKCVAFQCLEASSCSHEHDWHPLEHDMKFIWCSAEEQRGLCISHLRWKALFIARQLADHGSGCLPENYFCSRKYLLGPCKCTSGSAPRFASWNTYLYFHIYHTNWLHRSWSSIHLKKLTEVIFPGISWSKLTCRIWTLYSITCKICPCQRRASRQISGLLPSLLKILIACTSLLQKANDCIHDKNPYECVADRKLFLKASLNPSRFRWQRHMTFFCYTGLGPSSGPILPDTRNVTPETLSVAQQANTSDNATSNVLYSVTQYNGLSLVSTVWTSEFSIARTDLSRHHSEGDDWQACPSRGKKKGYTSFLCPVDRA